MSRTYIVYVNETYVIELDSYTQEEAVKEFCSSLPTDFDTDTTAQLFQFVSALPVAQWLHGEKIAAEQVKAQAAHNKAVAAYQALKAKYV